MNGFLSSYDSALAYAHAFRILLDCHMKSRLSGNYQDFSLITPLMSMGGFACELFMKSLMAEKCKSHRLYNDLFTKLDCQHVKEIETIVIHCMRTKKNKPKYDINDFRSDFEIQDRLFEDFRYIHEPSKTDEKKAYNIDFTEVLVAALQAVCQEKFGKRPINSDL